MGLETEAAGAATPAGGDYRNATVLAFVLCGILTLTSVLFPPGLNFDPGMGMLEWRTLVEGGPVNSIVAPDPTNIATDRTELITWWSPGQYLVPGVFTALGFKLGLAFSLTVGLSLLSCLVGWIRVLKHFAVSPNSATIAVALLSVFLYSTVNFRIYYGGEILLQGILPWLVLAGCQVPIASALRAGGLAGLIVLASFFAKLTGVLVAVATLTAGSVIVFVRLRRVTPGMVAGVIGATLAGGLLYVTWFAYGVTPASMAGWPFESTQIVFAAIGPWGAGVSWLDMWTWVWLRDLSTIVWLMLPPFAFFAFVIVWGWWKETGGSELRDFINFSVCFYAIYALSMEVLFMRGGAISIDERHLRSAGTLLFMSVIGVADRLPWKNPIRIAVFAFCGFIALNGVYTFVSREMSTSPEQTDGYSRTRQLKVDVAALEFARSAFAREGRDALFVIPFPDAASAFPPGARILLAYTDAQSEARLAARRYVGKVPGHVYVILQTRLARTVKGTLLLKEFADYPLDAWESHRFGHTTVFVQAAPAS